MTPFEFGSNLGREKAAVADLMAGGAIGAINAPQGHKLEGFARGAVNTPANLAGGLMGGQLGMLRGAIMAPGRVLGSVAGGVSGGARAGTAAMDSMLGGPAQGIGGHMLRLPAQALGGTMGAVGGAVAAPFKAIGGAIGDIGNGFMSGAQAGTHMMQSLTGTPTWQQGGASQAQTQAQNFGAKMAELSQEKAAERGLIADIGLYSNPFTGVPTGIYDTYNSLRNGNYLGALGNVAATGLSFTGGGLIGGGLKALGKGIMRAGAGIAGKGLAQAGTRAAVGGAMRGVGHGVANAGRAMNAFARPATKAVFNAQNTISRGMQRVVPVAKDVTWGSNPARMLVNKAVQNPYAAGAFLHTGGNPTGVPQPQLPQ